MSGFCPMSHHYIWLCIVYMHCFLNVCNVLYAVMWHIQSINHAMGTWLVITRSPCIITAHFNSRCNTWEAHLSHMYVVFSACAMFWDRLHSLTGYCCKIVYVVRIFTHPTAKDSYTTILKLQQKWWTSGRSAVVHTYMYVQLSCTIHNFSKENFQFCCLRGYWSCNCISQDPAA